MSTLTSKIQALLTYANGISGKEDTTLGDAVKSLGDGFGSGSAIGALLTPIATYTQEDDRLSLSTSNGQIVINTLQEILGDYEGRIVVVIENNTSTSNYAFKFLQGDYPSLTKAYRGQYDGSLNPNALNLNTSFFSTKGSIWHIYTYNNSANGMDLLLQNIIKKTILY